MAKDRVKAVLSARFRLSKKAVLALHKIETRTFAEGAAVLAAGKAVRALALVVEGYVAQVDGDDIVRLVGPGGVCGLEGLFGSAPASGYEAVTPATVALVPRAALERLAAGKAAFGLLRDLLAMAADVGDALAQRGRFLRGNNGSESIGLVLDAFGWRGQPPLKWKVIARYLGMNICAFSRSLARLRKSRRL